MNRQLLMLNLVLKRNGKTRAALLKKNKVFNRQGENCFYQPIKVPSEPFLVSLGNNVKIAANVTFITHDIISDMLNDSLRHQGNYRFFTGKIEILDDVFIGANSTILYNVKIGPNSIVAAGSMVVSDVPPDTIVGGNPARVIGSIFDLAESRLKVTATS